jgi:spermidine/putrescine transport system substrate-binding protein
MDPENAALISDFAKYSNGILGSDKYMQQLDPTFVDSPEFKIPAGLEPEWVPPCSKEVTDKYNKIWTALKK